MSHTRSQVPFSHTASMSVSHTWRTLAAWSRTWRGVNPRFTSLRRRQWSGSSMSIIIGRPGTAGRMPPALEYTSGARDT